MKFQYFSDIHLEIRKNVNILKLKDIDNLFLLGDICRLDNPMYLKYIKECSKKWKNIFVVYGNHEFYSEKFTMNELKLKYQFPANVHILDNKAVYIDKNGNVNSSYKEGSLKIIGSTLWSNIIKNIDIYMNDYSMINTSNVIVKLTSDITRQLFFENKQFILDELKEQVPSIILTHHGVSSLCNGIYIGNKLESAFATDIPELSNYKHLLACFNGHTHQSMNSFIPGTSIKLLSNCYGYPGEKTDFDRNIFYEF